MAKFTDLLLKNLVHKPTRYDLREGDGFGIRIFPKGGKSFFYIYQIAGHKRRMTLGKYPAISLKEARREHVKARALVQRRIDPIDKRRATLEELRRQREAREQALTVERLAGEYIERHAKPKKRTWEHDLYLLEKDVLPRWGNRKAGDITRRDVNLLLDRILDRGAPIHANRILSLVRTLFNFGVRRGELDHNPCLGITRPAPEGIRDRVLSDIELSKLWMATLPGNESFMATIQIRLSVRLQLLTAVRNNEAMGARWEEIDMDARWWEIPPERMKNKRPHCVWLTDGAIETLESLKAAAAESEWVFPSHAGNKAMRTTSVNRAISRNLESLSIAPFTPHDLRRTVSTRLGEIGILPHVVSKILSHTDQTVTGKHYDKYSYDREKRKALEAWSSYLIEIVEGKRQDIVVNLIPTQRGTTQ